MNFRTIFRKLTIYSILALPGLVIFFPILFAKQIFADGDVILQQYTSLQFLRESLLAGKSIFWNPHVLTGFVPVAGLMGGLLSWLNQLLYKNFSVLAVFSWVTFVNVWLISIFTFELVSRLGLRKVVAVFAGLVLPWTAAYFVWSANMTVTSGDILLPALFFFFLYFSTSQSYKKSILMAIFAGGLIGTVMLAAHFQWSLQALFAAGVWALFLDFHNKHLGTVVLFKFQTLVFAGFTLAIAAVLFWPQFHASLLASQLSSRAGGVSFADAQLGAVLPGDLLSLIFPNLSLPVGITQPGLFYLGAVPSLLVIFSFFGAKGAFYKFFAWLAVLSIAASVKYSPLMWVIHHLPLFQSFRGLSRLVYVGIFAATVVSAYGFETLLRQPALGLKLSKFLMVITLSIAGIFASWSIIFPTISFLASSKAAHYIQNRAMSGSLTLPTEHYYQVVEQLVGKIKTGTTFPNIPISAAVISLALGSTLFYFRRSLGERRFIFYVVSLTFLNLVLIDFASFNFVSAQQLNTPPPLVEYLKRDQSNFRVLTLFSGFTVFDKLDTPYGYDSVQNVELLKNLLVPNLGPYYGVDSLDYYDNIMDRRHSRLLAYLGSDRSLETSGILVDEKLSLDDKIKLFLERLPLLSEYNVKYVVSAYPLTDPTLKEVFTWRATKYEIPLYLYQNLQVKPRYYLANNVVFDNLLSEAQSWQKNLEAATRDAVLVECDQPCPTNQAGEGNITELKSSNSDFEFMVSAQTSRIMLFGQNFYPGWRATIDGISVTVYRANYLNQAIPIPPGKHRIVFQYTL
jgi:hypothetical protein